MPPVKFKSICALEENSTDVYLESIEILIKIARNILNEPTNPKFRSVSLGSSVVSNKLLNACGAVECLFEMGFQERDDRLVLPQESSLQSIREIYHELLARREKCKNSTNKTKSVEDTVTEKATVKEKELKKEDRISLIVNDLIELRNQTSHSFLKKMLFWCFYVLKYENHELQKKALDLAPIIKLHTCVIKRIRIIQMDFKKGLLKEEKIDYQEFFLFELCNWFNSEFFEWVNTPSCTKCGFIETTEEGLCNETFPGADRVEVYRCPKCRERILFPRYNDPGKLLETRKGRCGEWANCFCLFCRAMGWDTRLICDETDHVWVEVYSIVQSRWIHCDPCENTLDTPLMYEHGWKKNLSYVLAYSKDEVQDVTWRYSNKHKTVLNNRTKCSEQDLVDFLIKVRNVILTHASEARRNFVLRRTALELVQLMEEKKNLENREEKGRVSGSLSWRLRRGEILEEDFTPHIWKVSPDVENNKFVLSYNTSKDRYLLNSLVEIKNWKFGGYDIKSVMRKEEKEWKMTYLSIREGENYGTITWRFDTKENFVIGKIDLKLIRCTFGSGKVSWKMCSGDVCIKLPDDKESYSTEDFAGSKSFQLTVEMFAGEGPTGWQHAQILRQPLVSEDETFVITINFDQQ